MADLSEVTFLRFDAAGARERCDVIESIYADAYSDLIATGDPFESREAAMRRFRAHLEAPGFDLVLACHGVEPIGQAWGWPLQAGTNWWHGVALDSALTAEDGRRSFGVTEIMVRHAWAGRGIGRRLHDTLLGARPEPRAILLVAPSNERARRSYLHWGWRSSGALRPGSGGGPDLEVLIRDASGAQ